jgi:trigger factor
MQITETVNTGLKRGFQVVVKASDLSAKADAKLKDMAGRANIKGFRPGKVPVDHLKRLYGKSVMAEVVQTTIDEQSRAVYTDRKLKPAYQPEVKLPEAEGEVSAVIDGKQDLSFGVEVEVIPEFELKDATGLSLTKHLVEVSDAHIDEAINNIAAQSKGWETKDGAAATGDRVTISFEGSIDGVPFEGGKGEYGVKDLAGKPAAFKTKIAQVDQPKLPAIDEDFAKRMGFENVGALRDMVKSSISREFERMTSMKLKRDVLDLLDKQYSFDLPSRLVDAEYNGIWNALTNEMQKAKKTFADEDTTEEKARDEYKAIAARRVRLGLVLGTLGEKEGVSVTEQELQQALTARIRQFPGQEKQVYDFYRKNPNSLIELRGPIFEQKVVDFIVSKATVAEKTVSREDLQKMVEEDMESEDA